MHLNYSGDLVCAPADAARMQHGEGLHLLNLVAGNFTDVARLRPGPVRGDRRPRPALVGRRPVARMGVEYRNDLLGHVHALGPTGAAGAGTRPATSAPTQPDDWPPNQVACEELRALGATVGYAHPAGSAFPDDGGPTRSSPTRARSRPASSSPTPRSALVDSIDVISPFDDEGAVVPLPPAALLRAAAGGDRRHRRVPVVLHGSAAASNPPGWGRVYAHLGGEPLSVAAFQDAIRAGRTIVTNGPWLTLDVDGHGPGAVLDRAAGDRLAVRAARPPARASTR